VESEGFNTATDESCGLIANADTQNIDPALGPLADNGGPTETHMPLFGSYVIDRGWCDEGTTDQRGYLRPMDLGAAEDRQGNLCDIGAVEVAPFEASAGAPGAVRR
jgi:hypothetical protein